MNVVDASVLVEFLVGGERREEAEHAIGRERWVWAPALVDAEVGQALRRQIRGGEISARKAGAALDDLFEMRLQKVPHRRGRVDRAGMRPEGRARPAGRFERRRR